MSFQTPLDPDTVYYGLKKNNVQIKLCQIYCKDQKFGTQNLSRCMLIYGIPGIHVPVFIKIYVFDTAQHQKYLADFNNLNTKLTAII